MLVLNLIPERQRTLQRGRCRIGNLTSGLVCVITALCAASIVKVVWGFATKGESHDIQLVESEVKELKRRYDAHTSATRALQEALELDRALDLKQRMAHFSFRLARCAVPAGTTLSEMQLRRGEIVWQGVSQGSREVSEMLLQITRCCSVLRPLMTSMKRGELHGEIREDFTVRIPLPTQLHELLHCYEVVADG